MAPFLQCCFRRQGRASGPPEPIFVAKLVRTLREMTYSRAHTEVKTLTREDNPFTSVREKAARRAVAYVAAMLPFVNLG